jgi:uncharacterized protein YdaU (DUF1376 family)
MPAADNGGRLAYMRLYVSDILSDAEYDALTTEQSGAYDRLLFRGWQMGASLPNDDEKLRGWTKLSPAKWNMHRDKVMAFFTLGEDNRWRQKRQVIEYEKAKQEYTKKSEGGRRGGQASPKREGILKDTSSLPQGYVKQLQPELELEPELQPKPGDPAKVERAEREATARTQAVNWIAVECPSHLKKSATLARLILRLGRDDAIKAVQETMRDDQIGNPFAYLEAKLDAIKSREDATSGKNEQRPVSRKYHS